MSVREWYGCGCLRRLTFCVTHLIMHYDQGNHSLVFIFSSLGGEVNLLSGIMGSQLTSLGDHEGSAFPKCLIQEQ